VVFIPEIHLLVVLLEERNCFFKEGHIMPGKIKEGQGSRGGFSLLAGGEGGVILFFSSTKNVRAAGGMCWNNRQNLQSLKWYSRRKR